jgi:osomolarity two-component system sensor histidine kinase SLN1
LDEISSATTVALDILNELLLYDKLEKGVLELNKENAHIFELVEGASKMFAVQFRQKSINFEIVSALDEMLNKQSQSSDNKKVETNSLSNSNLLRSDQIFVDKHKVEQVLRNLISNAIKFTPIGGNVTVKMKFIPKLDSTREHSHSSSFDKLIDDCYTDESATTLTEFLKNTASGKILEKCHSEEKIKGTLQLEVIDTGAGMREEDQKRLFHEIVQFQPQILQNGGGSGLGMWISKGIMDLHGGKSSLSQSPYNNSEINF